MSTTITVIGTIATDPRLVKPAGGGQLCSFRLASDERRYDREKQSWVEGNTNWFGVVTFRGLASHAHESFHKGDRVLVTGKLRIRDWQTGEKRGTSIEIEAEAIGHDVLWGVSTFEKRSKTASVDQQATDENQQTDARQDAADEHGSSEEQPIGDGFTPELSSAA